MTTTQITNSYIRVEDYNENPHIQLLQDTEHTNLCHNTERAGLVQRDTIYNGTELSLTLQRKIETHNN